MTTPRETEIEKAIDGYVPVEHISVPAICARRAFKAGALWADANPAPTTTSDGRQWYPRDKVYIHGTDGCSNCASGRITMFVHSNQCIECNPKAYERGPATPPVTFSEDERKRVKEIREFWDRDGSAAGYPEQSPELDHFFLLDIAERAVGNDK